MHRMAGLIGALTLLALAAPRAGAQEFVPPDRSGRPAAQATAPAESGIRFGIFGFSTRAGVQVNQGSQGVIGSTVDVMEFGSPAVRLRPSFEMGFGSSVHSLAFNAEMIYRFQPDPAPAIPYLGLGVGYYDDGSSTQVWPTVVLGFELNFSRNINWLIEYHALDGLRRSRFLVGLSTRGIN
jgi:hypothetical protein